MKNKKAGHTGEQVREACGISRRAVLAGSVGLGAAALLARPAVARAQGGRVVIRTSGGSYQDALKKGTWDKFTKLTGIEVVAVPANTAKLLAMVESGNTQIDLVDGNATAVLTLQSKGALDKLDFAGFKYTDAKDLAVATDHYVGYALFAEALCYNTKTFAKSHPKSWAEFWDVKAFPGPRMLQDASAISPDLEFALLADGVKVKDLYPLDVDRAFAKMAEIKPHIIKFYNSGALGASMLSDGTVVLGSLWTNRVEPLKAKGAPLDVEWNQNMRLYEMTAVLKDAPNRDNALRLLDFACSPKAQAETLPPIGLSPANKAAYKLIAAADASIMPGSPENMAKGFDQDAEWWLKNRAAVTERWQEFLLQ